METRGVGVGEGMNGCSGPTRFKTTQSRCLSSLIMTIYRDVETEQQPLCCQ